MNTTHRAALILVLFSLATSMGANAQHIWINVSVKIVLNPVDGARPGGASDAAIQSGVTRMNELLEAYGRGYCVRLVDPITTVGGAGQLTGPSQWFGVDFITNSAAKDEMEEAAKSDPVAHAWNHGAINIYVTQRGMKFSGGSCSFPSSDEIIIVSGNSCANGPLILHEIGHYFNLCHTQGCSCADCEDCDEPGSDDISDTLEGVACWSQDQIAQRNFNTGYASLNTTLRAQVDDVYYNLMSYHDKNPVRLTELQLDRWTESANNDRTAVISGKTIFVDGNSWCRNPVGRSACVNILGTEFGGSFEKVADGITAASANVSDIVLLRPGNYAESINITKPVTLRATRSGYVTIGQ